MLGHLQVVKYIVQNVADIHPKTGLFWGQKTPLDYAREKGHTEIVAFLLEQNERLHANATNARFNQTILGTAILATLAVLAAFLFWQSYNILASLTTLAILPFWWTKCTFLYAALISTPPDNCTICFEPRNETYAFIPCGHASFCKQCAFYLFENGNKKCPTCLSRIERPMRVFFQ